MKPFRYSGDDFYWLANCKRCVWSSGYMDDDNQMVKCCDYEQESTPFETIKQCPAGGPVTEQQYKKQKEKNVQTY